MTVPFVVIVGAIAGLLLGAPVATPDRRLPGDRDALLPAALPDGHDERRLVFGHNVTGGPFGILNVDPFSLFGHQLVVQHEGVFAVSYLYVALGFFAVVFVALRFVNHSRTGRAWRSLREDPLAAEAMGMPVNWLKLMAFSFGAAVAALTGTLFAALNASVFPLTFYFVLLITVYTMVILGGSGNQAGVVLGALIVGPLLEVLRDPDKSRVLFFVALVAGVVLMSRRRSRAIGIVAVATLDLRLRRARDRRLDSTRPGWPARTQSGFAGFFDHWVVAPGAPGALDPADDVHRRDRGGPARDASSAAGCGSSCSCRRSTSPRSSGRT